jgi:hypothetical protein
MFPLAGLVVRFGPGQAEQVGEEPFGEAMAADHSLGQGLPCCGEQDRTVVGDQALVLEAADHLADRWPADLQPIGDSSLDDGDVVFGELEDALAVLLESGVVLS